MQKLSLKPPKTLKCRLPLVNINGKCRCLGDGCFAQKERAKRAPIEKSMSCWPGADRCSGGDGVCLEGVCHCLNGMIEVGGQCRTEYQEIGERCDQSSETSKCRPDAICVNQICECRIPGGCQEISTVPIVINRPCERNEHCESGEECVENICRCFGAKQVRIDNLKQIKN